jgi:hypothetical protein
MVVGLAFRPDQVLSAPRSPWHRAYVERVIGSIRRECLDHVLLFNEESLRRTLRSYFRFYHRSRLHLSLDKDSPDHGQYSLSGKSSRFRKSVAFTTATNVALLEQRTSVAVMRRALSRYLSLPSTKFLRS